MRGFPKKTLQDFHKPLAEKNQFPAFPKPRFSECPLILGPFHSFQKENRDLNNVVGGGGHHLGLPVVDESVESLLDASGLATISIFVYFLFVKKILDLPSLTP